MTKVVLFIILSLSLVGCADPKSGNTQLESSVNQLADAVLFTFSRSASNEPVFKVFETFGTSGVIVSTVVVINANGDQIVRYSKGTYARSGNSYLFSFTEATCPSGLMTVAATLEGDASDSPTLGGAQYYNATAHDLMTVAGFTVINPTQSIDTNCANPALSAY